MKCKSITMLTGRHLTATERSHIRQLVNLKYPEGGTKRKYYKILEEKGDTRKILILSKTSDDYGRPRQDRQTVTVKINY